MIVLYYDDIVLAPVDTMHKIFKAAKEIAGEEPVLMLPYHAEALEDIDNIDSLKDLCVMINDALLEYYEGSEDFDRLNYIKKTIEHIIEIKERNLNVEDI